MRSEKMIDDCLPCQCSDTCPLCKVCGGSWDYTQPNTKKLVCLCKHLEALAKELYERDGPNGKIPISHYAYQLFWTMHNEIKDTIDLLCKWEEPKNDRQNFLECYNLFCRCYNDYGLNFLQKPYERLRMITKCFENAFV